MIRVDLLLIQQLVKLSERLVELARVELAEDVELEDGDGSAAAESGSDHTFGRMSAPKTASAAMTATTTGQA